MKTTLEGIAYLDQMVLIHVSHYIPNDILQQVQDIM